MFLRLLFLFILGLRADSTAALLPRTTADFEKEIRPLLNEYCNKCHSTEKQKGDLDLERFTSFEAVRKDARVWELVAEQLELGEMPPKKEPQLDAPRRQRLSKWVQDTLSEIAREHAGDAGPVVLRRLSNAEYTHTIRDLTGVDTLDPAREFPVDGAAGEGFTNAGAALVMSPALLSKYLEAAKEIARHAVLLPDGFRFSPHVSERDWTEERLAGIRAFYARYTTGSAGTAVNLQGLKFDTNGGGVIPLESYLTATLVERSALAGGQKGIADVANQRGLNAKYLGTLWTALNGSDSSLLLEPIRAQWRAAKPEDAPKIAAAIAQWQKALWRFTTIGHIGKRDGPKAWQVPVSPLAERREVRMKIPAAKDGKDVTLYLVATDAGDGNANDHVLWENPRLVAPGRADIPLKDLRATVGAVAAHREKLFSSAAECLSAAETIGRAPNAETIARLAKQRGVDPIALTAWLDCLGIRAGEARIDSHLMQKTNGAQGYDFIKGWAEADALSVIANSSDRHVRVPGNMKPHSVAVHPSPKRSVIVGWRSPVAGSLRIEGAVQHAHPECGNGVAWALELRRGDSRQRLGAGVAHGDRVMPVGPIENVAMGVGDVVALVVSPRDGNHSCDLTAVDLKLSDGQREWNLAKDVSPDIMAGNPHTDSLGNAGVWHFYSEPADGKSESALPAGSLLAKWQATSDADEKRKLATAVQELLASGARGVAKDAPDAVLYRQLNSLGGPLFSSARTAGVNGGPTGDGGGAPYGVDAAMFGKHPQGGPVMAGDLCVQAPSVVEIRLPAELVEGCDFVTTGRLHAETGKEGSVQMHVSATRPQQLDGLAAGAVRQENGERRWTDGERPVMSDAPIVVANGSETRKRTERALDEFRNLFPVAVCYTKIVPVDEVVTLTLFYREDEHLRRLMLDDAEAAELDKLWAELRYVSRDALKLVDAFEQLWQFATQDGDPTAFDPMKPTIQRNAVEFRRLLIESEQAHLESVLKFAKKAWRRSLTDAEQQSLRELYQSMRKEEIRHEEALRLTLARVFVSPAFLYKLEKPASGTEQVAVNDFELASRLSYFLWSSAPDETLLSLAAEGRLRDPEVLVVQARRMLKDARVRRLAVEFGTQWLHVRDFDQFDEKSERHFPTFNSLRAAMNEEPVQFFTDFFQNDRSVLSLLDADHTFVNGPLAKHYGLSGIEGDEWRRVDRVRAKGRGGILGFAATLAKQSGASRTSPILRGNWLSETILGERLPRPPKDVPVLPDEAPTGLTERQLTEKHSSDESCARCHVRIDPFGFSMEAYDAIGRFRTKDAAGLPIDTRSKLSDGTELDGLAGIRAYLLGARREVFERQFARKLLGYALGRGVILSDQPLLDEIMAGLGPNEHRVSTLIEKIVRSRQFREIRGLAKE